MNSMKKGPVVMKKNRFCRPIVIVACLGFTFLVASPMAADAPSDCKALRPVPVNFAPGAKYADETRRFQGIPGIERAPNGRLWATWYAGGNGEGPENYMLLTTSGDDGKTWSKPKLVIDPPGNVRAFDPCLWLDPDGRLWSFWAQAISHVSGRVGTWAIVTDNADAETPNWSEPRRLCDGIMMNKPVVLDSGGWLLPTALWGRNNGDMVVGSTDKGDSFKLIGTANVPAAHRNCDEPMIVQRKDGSLWMLVRTNYGIGQSISTDGGKNWSECKPSSIQHPVARFFIRRLKSGKLLLVKHGPLDKRTGRSHLTAYLSDDEGKTWRGGLLLDERSGVSYPDAVQSPEGKIYLIYDYSRTGAKQILMAVFTEEAVAQGAANSKCRFRQLVNQATGTK